MDNIKLDPSINNTRDTTTSHKQNNNFYEIIVYLAVYMSIGLFGLIIKYLQEKFSGKKVNINLVEIIFSI